MQLHLPPSFDPHLNQGAYDWPEIVRARFVGSCGIAVDTTMTLDKKTGCYAPGKPPLLNFTRLPPSGRKRLKDALDDMVDTVFAPVNVRRDGPCTSGMWSALARQILEILARTHAQLAYRDGFDQTRWPVAHFAVDSRYPQKPLLAAMAFVPDSGELMMHMGEALLLKPRLN